MKLIAYIFLYRRESFRLKFIFIGYNNTRGVMMWREKKRGKKKERKKCATRATVVVRRNVNRKGIRTRRIIRWIHLRQ